MELSFKTGEVILVYGDMDEDGFFMGELDGVRGLVPSNFLAEAPEQYNNQMGPSTPNAQRNNINNRSVRGNQQAQQQPGLGARGPPIPHREILSTGVVQRTGSQKRGMNYLLHNQLKKIIFYLK